VGRIDYRTVSLKYTISPIAYSSRHSSASSSSLLCTAPPNAVPGTVNVYVQYKDGSLTDPREYHYEPPPNPDALVTKLVDLAVSNQQKQTVIQQQAKEIEELKAKLLRLEQLLHNEKRFKSMNAKECNKLKEDFINGELSST
jgi:hypothetical protein